MLLACSPTYNWREVQVGHAPLRALLPCKPERAERPVSMGGHEATLEMASCEAGGATFAVSAMALPDGMDRNATAQAWKVATLASLKSTADQAKDWPVPVNAKLAAVGWQATGVRHTGQAVQAHVVALTRGQELFQVAVYGDLPPEAMATLLDGLQFDGAP